MHEADEEHSVVDIVQNIITHGSIVLASDIHIEPSSTELIVRMRIDGALSQTHSLAKKNQEEIIARIKILAGLRTDVHFSPQDGRFRIQILTSSVDVRVSILPTYYGENAVLRLLSGIHREMQLSELGYTEKQDKQIQDVLKHSHGMILVTGPTGSGKTTTLYSLLNILNKNDTSIVTIEDPIEYSIPNVTQIQVREGTLTFATGLRSILRQDPDVIMVGEIRDTTTAQIAIHASLTGHVLLSTLHTNSASAALPRLIDMGIDPYLIASTISLVISQRLVRKICTSCKYKNTLGYFEGRGCDLCSETGFRGRTCLSEVLVIDDEIQKLILKKAHAQDISAYAQTVGMVPMFDQGLEKIHEGITTYEEILELSRE